MQTKPDDRFQAERDEPMPREIVDPPIDPREWAFLEPRPAQQVLGAACVAAIVFMLAWLASGIVVPDAPPGAVNWVAAGCAALAGFTALRIPFWSARSRACRAAIASLARIERRFAESLDRCDERLRMARAVRTAAPRRAPPGGMPAPLPVPRSMIRSALACEALRQQPLTAEDGHGLRPDHVDRLRRSGIATVGDLAWPLVWAASSDYLLGSERPDYIITGLTTGLEAQGIATIDLDPHGDGPAGAILPEWRQVLEWARNRHDQAIKAVPESSVDAALGSAPTTTEFRVRRAIEGIVLSAAIRRATLSIVRHETRGVLDQLRSEAAQPGG